MTVDVHIVAGRPDIQVLYLCTGNTERNSRPQPELVPWERRETGGSCQIPAVYYLRHGGYVSVLLVCSFVCLSVYKITEKVMNGF